MRRTGDGKQAIDSDGFHDRNHRYSYLVACENVRRIAQDPGLLAVGRRHLKRFSRDDPRQRDGYALWSWLLDGPPEAVMARLTEQSERADYARQTAPSFGGLPGPVRTRLLKQARVPLSGDHQPVAVE